MPRTGPGKILASLAIEGGGLALLAYCLPLLSWQHFPSAPAPQPIADQQPATGAGQPRTGTGQPPTIPTADRQRFVQQTLASSQQRFVAELEAHVRETVDSVLRLSQPD